MVLKRLRDIVQPDTTYTDRCHDCGEQWETSEMRHSAECPDCGGPPEPNWQA